MKKICFVTTVPGTIKSFILKSAEYLHNNGGFDITFICSPDKEFEAQLPEYIHFIPVKMERGVSIGGFRAMLEMKKIFKEHKFDIVQYSTPNAACYASIAAKLAGIKVRNYHLMGLRYLGMSGILKQLFKQIEKLTCALSTHVEFVSKSNMQLAINDGILQKDKAAVVWNGSTGGVDILRFNFEKRKEYKTDTRKNLNITEDDFVFGFAGRITKDKGIDEILSAFFSIEKKCKLLLIGAKEGLSTIDMELWKKAQLCKNIIILDSVNDIERYYCTMDVLLLPSYREGFGMVVAEAAAMGTPAIVSNIPGPIDVVEENQTALLVNVKDVIDLKDKMQYLFNNRKIVENMRNRCVDYIRNNFDSNILNQCILERKIGLISDAKK